MEKDKTLGDHLKQAALQVTAGGSAGCIHGT